MAWYMVMLDTTNYYLCNIVLHMYYKVIYVYCVWPTQIYAWWTKTDC